MRASWGLPLALMDIASGFSITTAAMVRSKRRRLGRILRWLAIAVVVAVLAAVGWSYATRPLTVVAAHPTHGPVADVVYATGFVEPRRPVDVSSRVTAPVTAVLADEGDAVARGQALATLDAEDQRHNIAQLAADRLKAEQDETRALMLFRQGWMAKAGRDGAVAAANSARAAEGSAKAKLDQYTIRSGISGVVLRRDAEPGDLATASKILFQIGDPKLLRVTATVDERDIPLVRNGLSALMSTEAFPGRVLKGTVYEITPGGDPDQRAFRVRIRPASGVSLPVGLTLEVNIIVADRKDALLVPAASIRAGAVWTVENRRLRRVPVEVGIRGTEKSEIRTGLSKDSCVVSDPPQSLTDGAKVVAKGC